MMEWISVGDRLPNGRALICFGKPFFGTHVPEMACGYYDEYSGKWLFWMSDKEVVGPGVTHWMPLPELPKSKDKEEA